MQRLNDTNGHNGRNGIEALAKLLGDGDHTHRYRGAFLPLPAINVLPQPRKTFLDIDELSLDIAVHGQIEPIIVAEFRREACARYLTVVNRLWHTAFGVGELHATMRRRRKRYYLLIAGERRYRALSLLWREGCKECRERYGKEPQGVCFKRHFKRKNDLVEVRLCTNAPPLPTLFLQLSENTHMQVPPHEEARAYALLFRLVRQANKKFTMAQFARRVGRSPDTVRNALRFSELPVTIRGYVENGAVPYGIGIELTRLHHVGLKARELDWWAVRALTDRKKVPEFHDLVTKYLAERGSNQMDLLGVMDRERRELQRRLHIRKTVQAHMVRGIWGWTDYFKKVLRLFEEGKIGKADSPFSVRSPIRIFLSLIELMERLLPHFRGLISRARHGHAGEVLARTRRLAKRAAHHAREDHSLHH